MPSNDSSPDDPCAKCGALRQDHVAWGQRHLFVPDSWCHCGHPRAGHSMGFCVGEVLVAMGTDRENCRCRAFVPAECSHEAYEKFSSTAKCVDCGHTWSVEPPAALPPSEGPEYDKCACGHERHEHSSQFLRCGAGGCFCDDPDYSPAAGGTAGDFVQCSTKYSHGPDVPVVQCARVSGHPGDHLWLMPETAGEPEAHEHDWTEWGAVYHGGHFQWRDCRACGNTESTMEGHFCPECAPVCVAPNGCHAPSACKDSCAFEDQLKGIRLMSRPEAPCPCIREGGCCHAPGVCLHGCAEAADEVTRLGEEMEPEAPELRLADLGRLGPEPEAPGLRCVDCGHAERLHCPPIPEGETPKGYCVQCTEEVAGYHDFAPAKPEVPECLHPLAQVDGGRSQCTGCGEWLDPERAPESPPRPPYAVAYATGSGVLNEIALPGDATAAVMDGALVISHPSGVLGIVHVKPWEDGA